MNSGACIVIIVIACFSEELFLPNSEGICELPSGGGECREERGEDESNVF